MHAKSIINPKTFLENAYVGDIISCLSELDSVKHPVKKTLLEISAESQIPDGSMTTKLKQLVRGGYVIKDGYLYQLNTVALMEVFDFWFERNIDKVLSKFSKTTKEILVVPETLLPFLHEFTSFRLSLNAQFLLFYLSRTGLSTKLSKLGRG